MALLAVQEVVMALITRGFHTSTVPLTRALTS